MPKEVKKPIVLGCTARDTITGLEGVVTGHCYYLTGCDQYLVQPKGKKASKPDEHWFDRQRLTRLDAPLVEMDNSTSNGCDVPAPKK